MKLLWGGIMIKKRFIDKIKTNRFVKVIKNEYGDEIKKSIEDIKHKDTFYKQIPNLLTFSRLVLAIPVGLLSLFNLNMSALGIIILWSTDLIDGKLARKFNIQSKIGTDMDTLADKIMFLASALPLITTMPILILNFILEGVISLINLNGRAKGLNTKTVLSGKIKTFSLAVTLGVGYLFKLFGFFPQMFSFLSLTTIALQFLAIKDYVCECNRMFLELKSRSEENDLDPGINEDKDNDKIDVLVHDKNDIDFLKRERDNLLESLEPDVFKTNIRIKK